MLKALITKCEKHERSDGQIQQRDGNYNTQSSRNANYKKKNAFNRFNSRLKTAEERVKNLRETTQISQVKGKKNFFLSEKNGLSIQELWDNNKGPKIHIIGIPEGKQKNKAEEIVKKLW